MTNLPRWMPTIGESLDSLGLTNSYIAEQILKMIYVQGALPGKTISQTFKIPFKFIEDELAKLKQQELLVVVGSVMNAGPHAMQYELTTKGRERAREYYSVRPYVGPMPVTIESYQESVAIQKMDTRKIGHTELKKVFANTVINPYYLNILGPAINSGGPLFIHGKPGNGKTMISERLIQTFSDEIYIPYCILVDGQVINFYDQKIHHSLTIEKNDRFDQRWLKIKRPFIVVGGELTLALLDLIYKDEFKYYEAPFQLKANGGILLIDDFGRQMVSPKDLLNRWIYPLEKGVDYLTLVTGKKIEVPFAQMLVFSTNLNPSDLGDDAFWRRIKYKIEIKGPSAEEFQQIFKNQCLQIGVEYDEESYQYLIETYYRATKRDFRGCHPRDLLGHVKDYISYYRTPNKLTKNMIDFSCHSYFVKKAA